MRRTHRVLITGGAGFVGANLAIALCGRHPSWRILAVDNLRRRGSELNLIRLRDAGVDFAHADIRNPGDLRALAPFDAMIECSAEPSASAGLDGEHVDYVINTNLVGAYHCLELARREKAQVVFLSTSRVYPMEPLRSIGLTERPTRFDIADDHDQPGVSQRGISEDFTLAGARTLYGTAKLSVEHLVEEYEAAFALPTVINRCGVIAGPWQMGRVDQGVFTYWMLHHHLKRPLTYIGYGGEGKQVRDVLHIDDLVDLVEAQLHDPEGWAGFLGNVGGGPDRSVSLQELTSRCVELTGNEVPMGSETQERPGDVPLYISDCTRLFERTTWRPARATDEILEDTLRWIRENEDAVAGAL